MLAKERILKAQNAVRKRVAMELLETERNYVKNLKTVQQLLINPIQAAVVNGARIMKDSEFYSCFANIIEILDSHCILLSALEERFVNWDDESSVGDIFLAKVSQMSFTVSL
jgi:hypothetical protein